MLYVAIGHFGGPWTEKNRFVFTALNTCMAFTTNKCLYELSLHWVKSVISSSHTFGPSVTVILIIRNSLQVFCSMNVISPNRVCYCIPVIVGPGTMFLSTSCWIWFKIQKRSPYLAKSWYSLMNLGLFWLVSDQGTLLPCGCHWNSNF